MHIPATVTDNEHKHETPRARQTCALAYIVCVYSDCLCFQRPFQPGSRINKMLAIGITCAGPERLGCARSVSLGSQQTCQARHSPTQTVQLGCERDRASGEAGLCQFDETAGTCPLPHQQLCDRDNGRNRCQCAHEG